jgi:hypothetical protein
MFIEHSLWLAKQKIQKNTIFFKNNLAK